MYACRCRAWVFLGALVVTQSAWSAEPLRMPEYPAEPPPAARTQTEVAALLAGAKPLAELAAPVRIVLVAGPKDHGRGEHDYPAWQKVWSRLLATTANTQVDTAWEFPTAKQIEAADVLVFYQRGEWNDDRAAAIDPFLARGGGLVYLHWAVDGRGQEAAMAQRIGLAALGGKIRYRHGELKVDFSPAKDHPIARNLSQAQWVDESYWALTGNPAELTVLGEAVEDGAAQPQFWTVERGRGRVFVSIPGHYMWTFDDPLFRTLIFRGIAWAGRRDVDRFNELVTMDARVE